MSDNFGLRCSKGIKSKSLFCVFANILLTMLTECITSRRVWVRWDQALDAAVNRMAVRRNTIVGLEDRSANEISYA